MKSSQKKAIQVLNNKYFTPTEYIDDLVKQLRSDIYPLFRVRGGAPFTVCRNIFCFIDHVSTLRYGPINQTQRMRKVLSDFAVFDNYLNKKYRRYKSYLVQIYRHDLVHNIRPLKHNIHIIDKKGKKIKKESWFIIYLFPGIKLPKPTTFNKLFDYYKSPSNRKNLCHLRYAGNDIVVNTYCLFFDFIYYLMEYKEFLEKDSKEENKFINNYNKEVNKEKYFEIKDFILDQRIDKEVKYATYKNKTKK